MFEKVFLDTIADIRSKVKNSFLTPQQDKINPDKIYDLIKACGLLRHLFIDNGNLVSQVNRKYKVPIIFHVVDINQQFPHNYGQFWFSLTPARGTGTGLKIKLAEFLKLTPLGYEKHYYSVLEIIQICSHVLGGIHTRLPNNEKEKMFLELNKVPEDGVYSSIYSICVVSLNALVLLEIYLKRHTPTGGFSPQS